jgi:uncharacterized protein (DUF58 family)
MTQLIDNASHPSAPLLTPEFLRKLERLRLISRRVFVGKTWGERRSKKRGVSVEFADFRNYAAGDDLRHLDWNALARLDRLFLRLFVEEEDLQVYILLDASRSMAFGDPPKFDYARRAAAALGYLALVNSDRLTAWVYGERLGPVFGPTRGKGRALESFHWFNQLRPEGPTATGASLKEFALRAKKPGLVIVLSDFFDEDHLSGLGALAARHFEVLLFHILDREELKPSLVGDLKLIDSETGEEREITITQGLLRDYQHKLQQFSRELELTCLRYGLHLIPAASDEPFEDLILRYLRKRRVVE